MLLRRPRPAVCCRGASKQDCQVDEPEQGELEEDEGDGAEGHAERAPEAGQQADAHRVEAGVDHRDDEAELAAEAEAGGEWAQGRVGDRVVGDVVGAVAVQSDTFRDQPRHFVGDEVGGSMDSGDAAEDRQHREEERRRDDHADQLGAHAIAARVGGAEEVVERYGEQADADRLQDAGDQLGGAVLIHFAQQGGIAAATANRLAGDDDRSDDEPHRGEGRQRRRQRPAFLPGDLLASGVHAQPRSRK